MTTTFTPTIVPLRIPSGKTELAATLFRPSALGKHPIVILHGGLAMPRQFYSRFAGWLASNGYACLTYDYAGMFGSRDDLSSSLQIDLHTWAERDMAAVTAWCADAAEDLPLSAIAHSFGGTLIGLSGSVARLDALMLVNSGSAYWGHTAASLHRLQRAAFAYVGLPVLSRLFGYFPGKALGVLGDLPKDVAIELAKWCRHPDYMLGYHRECAGFSTLRAPVISLTTEADHVFPIASVEWLAGRFATPVPVRVLPTSQDQPLGHFDFFDPHKGKSHWPQALTWLEGALQERHQPLMNRSRLA
jgi:predicted alpha/beta hydrolase